MNLLHVVILAVVQGLAELLPVSSSAHVIVAASLLHENMSTPANALLLVLLHTGTMFAVIAYFWRRWVHEFLSTWGRFWRFAKLIFVASLLSGAVGYPIIHLIERWLSSEGSPAVIETLFNRLNWIAPALAAVGVLILIAGLREARRAKPADRDAAAAPSAGAGVGASGPVQLKTAPAAVASANLSWPAVIWMGILQGIAIPFRGFSRSGSTISGGLLLGGERGAIESFSFVMVVAITPLAIARELHRVMKTAAATGTHLPMAAVLRPGILGMVCAFIAGLVALRWLSRWLEEGRWYWFGIYCLAAAGVVEWLFLRGF